MKWQLVNAYANIETILSEFDGTLDNITDEQWFSTDIDGFLQNCIGDLCVS